MEKPTKYPPNGKYRFHQAGFQPVVKLRPVRNSDRKAPPSPLVEIIDATFFGALAVMAFYFISLYNGIDVIKLLFGG